jgi:cell division protein FtsA
MSDPRPLVGIDVGSSRVCVVVGSCEGNELIILGCGQARHDGARKGVIATLHDVSDAIRIAAEEAEAMASVPVEEALVGLGGPPVLGMPAAASVPVTGRDHTVTREDVSRSLAACAQVEVPSDYRVLEVIPCTFAIDGHGGMDHPVGMPGHRLDASAFVLYTNKTHAETVEQSVNRGSIAVSRMVYEPLAAASAVLTDDEKDLGCLLVDIGYATTEWVLFADRAVVASGCLPVGGRHFTADLAAMLKTTSAAAEEIKCRIGASLETDDLDGEAVEVPALGGDGYQVHPARFVAEVLYERGRDLFIGVHRVLVEHHLDRMPRSGVVLTGGGARLEGLEELAERIFGHRTRVGQPLHLAGLAEPVAGPEWAVACGLIRVHTTRNEHYETRTGRGGLLAWVRHALGDFFEVGGGP